MEKTLYLLDGMALVYRSHFALIKTPIRNSKGVNTSAIFGFTNTLVDILKTRRPSHLAVAFDTSAPTARHKAYPEYKAQREDMPEELSDAIPTIKDIVRAFNLKVIERDGYEADDIIGTLAGQPGFTTYMVTLDKDFGQLVDDHTLIYRPGRQGGDVEIWGIPEVCEKWGIERPEQVIDCLALIGDASDNIPGVPGIGPKTAQKLIATFGSLEALLDRLDEVKGKQQDNIRNHADQARLCKTLATIDRHVPLDVTPEDLVVGPVDEERLKRLFIELEFNSLGQRLFGDAFHAGHGAKATEFKLDAEPDPASRPKGNESTPRPAAALEVGPDLKTIEDIETDYRVADTTTTFAEFLRELSSQEAFAFDTETDGLDPRRCQLVGISFSWKTHCGWWVPVQRTELDRKEIITQLSPIFNNPKLRKIAHNAKFDLAVLRSFFGPDHWESAGAIDGIFDTMIAHALAAPDLKHGLNALAESLLGYRPIKIEAVIGEKGADQQSMVDADPALVARYATEDADIAWQLHQQLIPMLESSGQTDVFGEIEMPVLPSVEAMEAVGIGLDLFALEEFSERLGQRIQQLTGEIERTAGHPFNLNSPKQLGAVLFDELKLLDKPKKTATGQYKTDEQTLVSLNGCHPIIEQILEYRSLTKLKGTYVDALPNAVHPKSGRVHTTFHQAATTTGRMASSDPNLQNIPIRTDMGREIRKAFIPSPGHLILAADYSQIELRILAAVSGDPGMLQAFADDLDIHTATAAGVFDVEPEDVTPDMRRKAKMVNFGISYGISAFGLSQRLGIPRNEAAGIIENYFARFSGIKRYMEDTVAFCREHGYVETLSGRRRHLPDIHSSNNTVKSAAERNAINMPIQGTAADLIKLAMAHIHRDILASGLRSRMLLQVHDELVFELVPDEEEALRKIVLARMINALPALTARVPVRVEIGTGANWLEAH